MHHIECLIACDYSIVFKKKEPNFPATIGYNVKFLLKVESKWCDAQIEIGLLVRGTSSSQQYLQ